MDVKDLYQKEKEYLGKEVEISGWIKNHRKQKEFGFIDFSDGTCFKSTQLVYDNKLDTFEEIQKYRVGSAIKVTGTLIKSEGNGQNFDIKVKDIVLLGDSPEDYPIQPKRHSREFLREQAYLRPRTNLFNAVFRVRSIASMAIHTYFQERGYVYAHTPIITSNDGEGAGEMFQVTTLDLEKIDPKGIPPLVSILSASKSSKLMFSDKSSNKFSNCFDISLISSSERLACFARTSKGLIPFCLAQS